jgi:uncharacterized membrane protein
LDRKIYTHDESLTSLRVAGYTEAEYDRDTANRELTAGDLVRRYQAPDPSRGLPDTIRVLALDDPQHPPLYYAAQRLWSSALGSGIVARRSLAAVLSIAAIGAFTWFCQLLFRSPWVTALATILFAISPFEVVHAQQNREYSLWVLTTLISSALLLRVVDRPTLPRWTRYGASIAVGLYSHFFFGLVILAHAIFVMLRFRTLRVLRGYVAMTLAAGLAFVPWVVVTFAQRDLVVGTSTWYGMPSPWPVFLYKWLFNVCAHFFDLAYADLRWAAVLPALALLIGFSIVFLAREGDRCAATMIIALFAGSVVPLQFVDLALHESRSTAGRYLLPAWLALSLSLSFLLATKVARRQGRPLWLGITLLVTAGELASCAVSSRSEAWYTGDNETAVLSIVHAFNGRSPGLIATPDRWIALEIASYLEPEDRIYIGDASDLADGSLCQVRYLINPVLTTLDSVRQRCHRGVAVTFAQRDHDSPVWRSVSWLRPLRERLAKLRSGTGAEYVLWRVRQD